MNHRGAYIFDLNGTMIDDMQYHTEAWYNILNNELGANLSWEQVKAEMYGRNEELLVRVFGNNKFSPEEISQLVVAKEKRYQQAFLPKLCLIDGLADFLKEASEQNIPMAIGSAAIPFNIDFVLDGLNIRHYFKAIVSGDDVRTSKPDPETFLKCAQLLGVDPQNCLVFEDAPKGVEAAQNAGMQTIVLTTMHERPSFADYTNIKAFVRDYHDPCLEQL